MEKAVIHVLPHGARWRVACSSCGSFASTDAESPAIVAALEHIGEHGMDGVARIELHRAENIEVVWNARLNLPHR